MKSEMQWCWWPQVKTSLEVPLTTFRLLLLTYSFQLKSAFLSRRRNWFSHKNIFIL